METFAGCCSVISRNMEQLASLNVRLGGGLRLVVNRWVVVAGLWLAAAVWPAAALAAGLDGKVLRQMDAEINQAIAQGQCPGAVLWVEHGNSRYDKAYGKRALVPKPERMTKDTIFDLASLTKVVAGTRRSCFWWSGDR